MCLWFVALASELQKAHLFIYFFASGTSVLTLIPFEIKETAYSLSDGTSAKDNYKLIHTQ